MDSRLINGYWFILDHVCGLWQSGWTGQDETWQAVWGRLLPACGHIILREGPGEGGQLRLAVTSHYHNYE